MSPTDKLQTAMCRAAWSALGALGPLDGVSLRSLSALAKACDASYLDAKPATKQTPHNDRTSDMSETAASHETLGAAELVDQTNGSLLCSSQGNMMLLIMPSNPPAASPNISYSKQPLGQGQKLKQC